MENFIEEIILSNEDIVKVCEEIGKQISEEYENKNPLLIGLLKGSVPFMAELMKHIKCDMEIDFMEVSSYSGTHSTGAVTILKDVRADIRGRDIILVEDIVDSGLTIQEVINFLSSRGARSIEIATLLDKPDGRTVKCQIPKYIGATIEPKFVVGFGLDYNQKYRNLGYVGVLKRWVYEK